MIHFFHQLRLYITFEVIEPAWLHMNARMKAASTLDEVSTLPLEPSEPVSAESDHGAAIDIILRQLAFDVHGSRGCMFDCFTALYNPPCISDEHHCHRVHHRQVRQQSCSEGLFMLRWADLGVAAQVMEAHAAYLKRILKGTLLSRKVKLLQQLNSIINVGHRFGETTRRLEEKTALDPVPLEDPATGPASAVVCLSEAACWKTPLQWLQNRV